MSKIGAIKRQRSQHAPRKEARRDRVRQSREADGPVPDIWDVPGAKFPGSPQVTKDDPVDILLTDVRGERVCVVRKKYYRFRNTGLEPNEAYLWRPQRAPLLWSGSRNHHALTHALRLLQVCSCTFEGHDRRSEERLLRGDILPETLIEFCGAPPSYARTLVALLVEHGLLRCEDSEASKSPAWFVNMRIRGIAPGMELLDSRDIPEMVLPEYISTATRKHREPAIPEEGGAPLVTATAIAAAEQPLPVRVYRVLVELVSESPNVMEENFAKFSIAGDFNEIIATRLGCTPNRAKRALDQLRVGAEVYRTRPAGQGKSPNRFVKLDAEEQVTASLNGSATARPTRSRGRSQPARATPPTGTPGLPPGAREVKNPEEFNQIWSRLSDKLSELRDRAETAERQLEEERRAHAETRTELEKLQVQSPATFILPAELAQFLDS